MVAAVISGYVARHLDTSMENNESLVYGLKRLVVELVMVRFGSPSRAWREKGGERGALQSERCGTSMHVDAREVCEVRRSLRRP